MPIIADSYPEFSSGAPSLVEWDNALYLGWAGAELTPAHHLNIIQSGDGVNFTNKVTLMLRSSLGLTKRIWLVESY